MAYKSKTDDTAYRQLKKDLSSGEIGRLYVFHGEEAYLRDHYLRQMKEKLLPGGWRSSTSTPSVPRSLR